MDKNKAMAKRQEVENYAASLEQQIEACKSTKEKLHKQQEDNNRAMRDKAVTNAARLQALQDKYTKNLQAKTDANNAKVQAKIADEDLELELLKGELRTARAQAVDLTRLIAEEGSRKENSF